MDIWYEGEYFCNKKWNGKGYNRKHEILYELNNGKGKVVEYSFGKLEYVGEYLNGTRNGKVREYYNGKVIFVGEYLNGERIKRYK